MTAVKIFFFSISILCCTVNAKRIVDSTEDRSGMIEDAINEVRAYMDAKEATVQSLGKEQYHNYRHSASSLVQGKTRIQFEKTVKAAEKKIIQSRRRKIVNDREALAESLAQEVLHTPGTLLNQNELARIYEVTCGLLNSENTDCSTNNNRRYRTASGYCNNQNNLDWGAVDTQMSRILPARYEDGVSAPTGKLQMTRSPIVPGPFLPPLPSPRVVSTTIIQKKNVNDTARSLLVMQWGQFIDHDMDLMPEIEHCPENCEVNEECAPFPIELGDEKVLHQGSTTQHCHPFRRSLGVCMEHSATTPREHMNAISHFIDGSNIYHHNIGTQRTVMRNRSQQMGVLNEGDPAPGTVKPLLPNADLNANEGIVGCLFSDTETCFLAGDVRANEQPGLISMHTLWMREHNRVARRIKERNPDLNEFNTFQIARSIVIAEIQTIHYSDYLPLILGEAITFIPGYQGYDPSLNPNIPNAFASAAFRFGHSQVQPFFERLDSTLTSVGAVPLGEAFFRPSLIRQGGIDQFVRGLIMTPSQIVDPFMNSILTSAVFAGTPGLDLASLNIMRGRDHGLPSYIEYKNWALQECGLSSPIRNEVIEVRLLLVYGSIENVDLFVGGLAEEPVPGGAVGATFACIFARTFTRLRDGDRFFYKREIGDDVETSKLFTPEQINEVQKTSIARIICDNTEGDFNEIQQNAFLLPTVANNPTVACRDLPRVALRAWDQPVTASSDTEEEDLIGMLQNAVEMMDDDVNYWMDDDVNYWSDGGDSTSDTRMKRRLINLLERMEKMRE